MSLSSLYLDAFVGVAKTGGFSNAAQRLHITQSALSQRIKHLEEELGLTLFIRTTTGATLTDYGECLLRYCQTKDCLEQELIEELNVSNKLEISGTIRLASYSSVLQSCLIPALKPLLDIHPNVLCDFSVVNMDELPRVLQRGAVDFIVMDYTLDKSNLETVILGQEEYVQIEPSSKSSRNDIFLDNNVNDRATELFFRSQGIKSTKYRRSYFDDCYGIINGVALGLGSAVMPKHLVDDKRIKINSKTKPFRLDVVLHYYQQSFYSKLHQSVVDSLIKNTKNYL